MRRTRDVCLYHLGNNQLHAGIYRRALGGPEWWCCTMPCCTISFWARSDQRRPTSRSSSTTTARGVADLARELWRSRARSAADPRYFEYPMLRRIAETSRAVVVHNPGAARDGAAHAPGARVVEIPHLYRAPAPSRRPRRSAGERPGSHRARSCSACSGTFANPSACCRFCGLSRCAKPAGRCAFGGRRDRVRRNLAERSNRCWRQARRDPPPASRRSAEFWTRVLAVGGRVHQPALSGGRRDVGHHHPADGNRQAGAGDRAATRRRGFRKTRACASNAGACGGRNAGRVYDLAGLGRRGAPGDRPPRRRRTSLRITLRRVAARRILGSVVRNCGVTMRRFLALFVAAAGCRRADRQAIRRSHPHARRSAVVREHVSVPPARGAARRSWSARLTTRATDITADYQAFVGPRIRGGGSGRARALRFRGRVRPAVPGNAGRRGHAEVDRRPALVRTATIGMIGGSYLGIVQWKAALANNPHLKAIFPMVSGCDDYLDRFYSTGGALKLGPAAAVDVRKRAGARFPEAGVLRVSSCICRCAPPTAPPPGSASICIRRRSIIPATTPSGSR